LSFSLVLLAPTPQFLQLLCSRQWLRGHCDGLETTRSAHLLASF